MDYRELEIKMIKESAVIAKKLENGIKLTKEDIDLLIEMSDAYGILPISTIWKLLHDKELTGDEIEYFCFMLRIINAKKNLPNISLSEESQCLGR